MIAASAAVTLTLALPATGGAHTGCHSARCTERVAAKRCSQARPVSCIHRAALHWRVSYSMLRRKAWCESRFIARASNGSHFGIFQFAPSTWATTPYRSRWIFSAKWSALAGAWMHHRGRGHEWSCV